MPGSRGNFLVNQTVREFNVLEYSDYQDKLPNGNSFYMLSSPIEAYYGIPPSAYAVRQKASSGKYSRTIRYPKGTLATMISVVNADNDLQDAIRFVFVNRVNGDPNDGLRNEQVFAYCEPSHVMVYDWEPGSGSQYNIQARDSMRCVQHGTDSDIDTLFKSECGAGYRLTVSNGMASVDTCELCPFGTFRYDRKGDNAMSCTAYDCAEDEYFAMWNPYFRQACLACNPVVQDVCVPGAGYTSAACAAGTVLTDADSVCGETISAYGIPVGQKGPSTETCEAYGARECGVNQAGGRLTSFVDDSPLHPVVSNCGADLRISAPACRACRDFAREGYYLHSCEFGIADVRECTAENIAEWAEVGYVWMDCGTLDTFDLVIGPGNKVDCASLALRGEHGTFLSTCETSAIAYSDCLSDGTQCSDDAFQVLCGANAYDLFTKYTLYTDPLDSRNVLDMSTVFPLLDNTFPGICIDCDTWAHYRCPGAGQVLVGCGLKKTDLVSRSTWFGDGSGQCATCAELGVEYCAERAFLEANPSVKWYRANCDQKEIRAGGLDCQTCDPGICAPGEALQGCGGVSPGVCSTCSLADWVSTNIEFHAEYGGEACSFGCTEGFTGAACGTYCEAPVCAEGEYATECRPPYQGRCKTAPFGYPARSHQQRIYSNSRFLRGGDFDDFLFVDAATGVAVDGVREVADGTAMQHVAHQMIAPELRWRTNAQAWAVPCVDSTESAFWPRECVSGGAFLRLSVPHDETRSVSKLMDALTPFEGFRVMAWLRADREVNVSTRLQLGSLVDETWNLTLSSEWQLFTSNTPGGTGITVWTLSELFTLTFDVLNEDSATTLELDDVELLRSVGKLSLDAMTHSIDGVLDLGAMTSTTLSHTGVGHRAVELVNGFAYVARDFQQSSPFQQFVLGVRVLEYLGTATSLTISTAAPTGSYVHWHTDDVVSGYIAFFRHGNHDDTRMFTIEVRGAEIALFDFYAVFTFFPTWNCDAFAFREGTSCTPCTASVLECPEPRGYRVQTCSALEYTRSVRCTACSSIPANAEWADAGPGVECAWRCKTGFFLDVDVSSFLCAACNTSGPCAVGQYRTLCVSEVVSGSTVTNDVGRIRGGDSQCLPCNNIATNVRINANRAVYTSASTVYGASECEYACEAGWFLNGLSCFPCSSLQCPFQKHVACTATEDARCEPCGAPPYNRRVVGGSPSAGEECQTACPEGHIPCSMCDSDPSGVLFDAPFVPVEVLLGHVSEEHQASTATTTPLATPLATGAAIDTVRVGTNTVFFGATDASALVSRQFYAPETLDAAGTALGPSRSAAAVTSAAATSSTHSRQHPIKDVELLRGDTYVVELLDVNYYQAIMNNSVNVVTIISMAGVSSESRLRLSFSRPAFTTSVLIYFQYVSCGIMPHMQEPEYGFIAKMFFSGVLIRTEEFRHRCSEPAEWAPSEDSFGGTSLEFPFRDDTDNVVFEITPNKLSSASFSVSIRDLQVEFYASDDHPCLLCEASGGLLCLECDDSLHPVNSTAVAEGASCTWVCEPDFKTVNDTACLYCPAIECAVGQYQSDCGACAACVMPEAVNGLAEFITAGGTWDPALLPDLSQTCGYECTTGSFRSVINGELHCTACSDITCGESEWHRNCTLEADAACEACSTTCTPGTNLTVPCSAYADAGCTPCTNEIATGATWTDNCSFACVSSEYSTNEYLLNEEENTCVVCQPECDKGEYNVTCAASNNWRGCRECALPNGNVEALTSGIERYGCQWRCKDGSVYNAAREECVTIPVDEEEPATCRRSDCAIGKHAVSNALGQCVCKDCPARPADTVWMYGCTWACIPPRIRNDDRCVMINSGTEQRRTELKVRELDGPRTFDRILLTVPIAVGVTLVAIATFMPRVRRRGKAVE